MIRVAQQRSLRYGAAVTGVKVNDAALIRHGCQDNNASVSFGANSASHAAIAIVVPLSVAACSTRLLRMLYTFCQWLVIVVHWPALQSDSSWATAVQGEQSF